MKNKNESNDNKTVIIGKGSRGFNVKISSKSLFFKEAITYSLKDGCLYLRHATIDDDSKIIVPCFNKTHKVYSFHINIGDREIELKTYNFDEDSNDDCVIIELD